VIDQLFCGLVFCYKVLSKIVQNGLPALALWFFRIRRLRIKRDAHRDAVCCWNKLDDTGAVAEDRDMCALAPPTGGRRQQVLQLLLPELCKRGGEVPARVFARRDQEQSSVLYALNFAIRDPGFRRIAFVIR